MLVFTYGTLRRNASNPADTRFGAEYIGPDSIVGNIYDLGWYPGLILHPPTDGTVQGDVFRVIQEQLEALDGYEGAPFLYSRRRVNTLNNREVFVYVYNGEVSQEDLIPTGDWLEYEAMKEVL